MEYRDEAIRAFEHDVQNRTLKLNVEYRNGTLGHATLADPTTDEDVVKTLIADGLLLVEKRREKRLLKLVSTTVDNRPLD